MNTESHRDPHRVVCVGDLLVGRKTGVTESLERLCRIGEPEAPWKFWHQGEPSSSAASLREEAIWKALGLNAGRLILSLGTKEILQGDFSPAATAAQIRTCMDLLADKGPGELWLLLPIPAFWPLARRPAVEELRQILAAQAGRWKPLDTQPRAERFLSSQSRHPDLSVALVEDSAAGPVPTGTGALLVASEIHRLWFP
ncbi:MAG: hypothetical protein IPK50_01680 [Fibrobacterota bacterium]|nr:hypothetical protein [Fibrobacterota bacterium]QQS05612.1 MAG: hypothetical protein IPK50_01680 [Fibrobacterota bacterium]